MFTGDILKSPRLWAMGAVLIGSTAIFAQTPAPQVSGSRTMVINMSGNGQSYIGVGVGEIDSDRARQLKLKEEYGVELTHVEEESPAAKAGLKSGDVVLEYNGQRVEGMEQFARFVRETPAGRDAKLTISRDGNRQMIPVKIGQRKMTESKWTMNTPMIAPVAPVPPVPPGDMARPFMVWQSPRMGIDAEAVEGQLGQFFGVKEGVLIRSVVKGSAAEKAGLRAGDVITKVDGSTVTSPGEVTRTVRSAHPKKTFPITVIREKRETTISVTVDENDDHSQKRFFYFSDGDGGSNKFEIEPGQFDFHFDNFDGPSKVRTIHQ
jgi:serine protease Do